MISPSTVSRAATVARLKEEAFDVLVIGGGITGAGIALDAASRGLRVALVEKEDFAAGTSSRSTKLIHGGLRYLKQLEFALVKEVGSERAIVHRLAPHLVVPEKMLLPLYEKRGLGYWLTSIGLKVYDWLAGVKAEDQRKMLTKKQTLAAEPLLKPDDVKGGALYAEYRTDDARLTIEIVKLAHQQGALVANYLEVNDFTYQSGQLQGACVVDHQSQQSFPIRATAVVNATGPWVDDLRTINKSKEGKTLHLTKGVHIVVPYHRLPVRQAIYFDVPDGRMIFAIPRGRVTYIGTTDTDYHRSKEEVTATRTDVKYLIDAVNETFPNAHLTQADVESTWAGLRPLIHEDGKSASELSRKDEIFESPTGLISIAGGKLTGYRKMAERVTDRVIEKYFSSRQLKKCATDNLVLPGGDFTAQSLHEAGEWLAREATARGLRGSDAARLLHLYGTQAPAILARMRTSADAELSLLLAEARFCIESEFALRPTDFLVRRSGLLYFNYPQAVRLVPQVLALFAESIGWAEEITQREEEQLTKALAQVKQFIVDAHE
jgi:glycerol-3-phosphate dehydrogenase